MSSMIENPNVVGRYRNKDDVRKMPELLAFCMETIHQGGLDFLGAVAGELSALDSHLGQFFTPYEVSRLMAGINLKGVEKTIKENGFVTVSEPTVGAGGMVIAVADVIEELGFDPSRHLWVEAIELSQTSFHMAYVQINARGVAGKVIHGNSLSSNPPAEKLLGQRRPPDRHNRSHFRNSAPAILLSRW